MIPPDVASALRLQLPDQARVAAEQPQNQPVAPAQKLTDALNDLAPGQRIMAEIQAMLPNGTYRAIVAQRNVTLALPFSAKTGDMLELEVSESNGELALAFVANRSNNESNATTQNSVPTSLSAAGKLIGELIGDTQNTGKQPPPVLLNGSQPLVSQMPSNGAELAPILKQALTESGIFYEAHQARWVEGELPIESLRKEPQGKLPPDSTPLNAQAISIPINEEKSEIGKVTQAIEPHVSNPAGNTSAQDTKVTQEIPNLVRQQLDGLASNNFSWHGQIWPGQQMRWEIGDHSKRQTPQDLAPLQEWFSRLKLSLPALGSLDATLRLQAGGKVLLQINADSQESERRLRTNLEHLRTRYETAGIELTQANVEYGPSSD